ncbi:glycosyltransferase [Synechococcus sp. CCY9201]|uniref:glycosyltransferase family 2 protein n=1 Tax=Synechococcus sp. CCY9201 TaxID=174697 RepID=UPI002B1FED16|nr:glycosyltransferase [Synechococcus sp. CCY9201]MEA5475568.1 glycosyltransferase [Synechococcus sp. CCY9201]
MPAQSLLIVVPTLNSHPLLPRLLASLQQQTWPHWQLLFIDGPSGAQHRQWLQHCCAAEPRCRWVEQDPAEPGIFGAMNQGFAAAGPADWLLFWGSDDWAASPTVLAAAMAALPGLPDLLVCSGRYVAADGQLSRPTAFHPTAFHPMAFRPLAGSHSQGRLDAAAYRRALWLGSTPPHQATLVGPGARRHLARYAPGFRLSADLDYFLQLSRHRDLQVQCLDLELVHMAAGGISGQQTQRRLQEVRHAYRRAFGGLWWFPFLARYARRLASLVEARLK